MKFLNYLVIASIAFLFSCADADKKDDTKTDSTAETVKEETTNKDSGLTETVKPEETANTGVLKLEDIKVGDIIEGLTVSKVVYKKNESYYSIELKGEFTTAGTFSYNDFEDSMDMTVDADALPKTKISIEGTEYPFYMGLNFSPADIEALLGKANLKKVKSGEPVSLKDIKVKNLIVGAQFDKGRLGMGSVDLVK